SLSAASPDLADFVGHIADAFFRTCKEELGKAIPGALFLGCRFAGPEVPVRILQAAARHSDVLSFNLYQRDLDGLVLPPGVTDRPILIGEFQIGALDHGAMHEGLVRVSDERERGEAYRRYILSALSNPNVVGIH